MRRRASTLAACIAIVAAAACAGSEAERSVEAASIAQMTASGAIGAGAISSDPRAAAESITPAEALEHVSYLASDELRGRDTPSDGLELAARYIADRMAEAGVEPAGDDGFFQRWPYPIIGIESTQAELAITAGGRTTTLRYGADYAAQPASAGRVEGRPVVTGTATQLDALSAASGEIALVFLTGPADAQWVSARTAAAEAAVEAGARAVVFVLDPGFGEARVAAFARELGITRRIVSNPAGIPTAYVTAEAAAEALRPAGVDLAALRSRAASGSLSPTPLEGVTLAVATPARIEEDARAPNVVGIVRGSDPQLRDTYVVVSAHMDHVGAGARAGETVIFNGADDNASGTTAVLMMARAMAQLETPPARSVVFLLVSGEEKGLLGSRWWVDHPTVPIENVVANINIDMIGRNHPDSVSVLGQEYSSLGPLVHRVNEAHPELNMTVAPDLWPREQLFFRSDQFNFARKEIPNLFFFAGLHEDYHQPSDTVEKIDEDKIARVARLVFYSLYEIANDPNPPEWTPAGLNEVRQMVGGR
ncbi:MAG TPA: M28 family peptidase [Longimicrobiales bacterium]|nr:M28 family peptidase [Longimicrobiales bacterium]